MSFIQKFYIADTHFGHLRNLELSNRPFASIEEHDEVIIRRWNAVVRENDIVYHLGDFALGLYVNPGPVRSIFNRLAGRKYLVIGNHDLDEHGALHPVLAELDWYEQPRQMMMTRDGGGLVHLCHYALRTWSGAWHFYGHSHGKLPGVGQSRDVGVDMPDVAFQPRTFAELTARK